MSSGKTRLLNFLFGLLLAIAGSALLSGIYAGLIRLGLVLPSTLEITAIAHGPLMINGFLGTLISLERGAALEKVWTYMAPASFAASILLMITGHLALSGYLLIIGSVTLFLIMIYLCKLQAVSHHVIMAAGAACLMIGNILFILHFPIFELIGWWIAFPLLTIFGERLELNRITRPPASAVKLFTVLIFVWVVTLIGLHVSRDLFWTAGSAVLIAIAVWLIRYDVARRTIRSVQWTKYSAWSLLTGYGWIVIGGVLGLIYHLPIAGPQYDAILHIYFVGFVFSMIFAHAAVIIPSLTGKMVPYSNYFYLPLTMLHVFLLLRVLGDLMFYYPLRLIGSYGNTAAIILFLGGIIVQLIRSKD